MRRKFLFISALSFADTYGQKRASQIERLHRVLAPLHARYEEASHCADFTYACLNIAFALVGEFILQPNFYTCNWIAVVIYFFFLPASNYYAENKNQKTTT